MLKNKDYGKIVVVFFLREILVLIQGSHRLEKYFNIDGFLEKSLKVKYALKSTGKITQKALRSA